MTCTTATSVAGPAAGLARLIALEHNLHVILLLNRFPLKTIVSIPDLATTRAMQAGDYLPDAPMFNDPSPLHLPQRINSVSAITPLL